jgi:hypothetical protein
MIVARLSPNDLTNCVRVNEARRSQFNLYLWRYIASKSAQWTRKERVLVPRRW